ncbi:MAG TPA: cyclic nucleotide-binding domain-containing protein [Actinomycetota bacterium]|jgi:CRP-like cAMP-binding protein|nr:cyclic nucleotide-binding domain-containing protein [Actinomycetota bacterium]
MERATLERLLADQATGTPVRFPAGAYLFREGETADRLLLMRSGRVALELLVPGRGPLIIDTIRDGQALGLSWIGPPRRWQFDARALEPVEAVAFDGAALLAACERDPRLGYQLTLRLAEVMLRRMQSARLRLIDLYGHADAS